MSIIDRVMGTPPADLPWLSEQLARYTYKPDWTLGLDVDRVLGLPRLAIAFPTVDVYRRHMVTQVSSNSILSPLMRRDPDVFAHTLRDAIRRTELHEIDEWLWRDGAILNDPHKQP